jgi:nucleoid-associated protein YgaU
MPEQKSNKNIAIDGQTVGANKAAAKPAGRKHTVAAGETLSQIAQKYYGSVEKTQWMKIYEANKAVIGADPGKIKPGQELVIPD